MKKKFTNKIDRTFSCVLKKNIFKGKPLQIQ